MLLSALAVLVISGPLAVPEVWFCNSTNILTRTDTSGVEIGTTDIGPLDRTWEGMEMVGAEVWAVAGDCVIHRLDRAGNELGTIEVLEPDTVGGMDCNQFHGIAPVEDEVWIVGRGSGGFLRVNAQGEYIGRHLTSPAFEGIVQVGSEVWGVSGSGPGMGDVFVYDLDGQFVRRFTPTGSVHNVWSGLTVVDSTIWLVRRDKDVFRLLPDGSIIEKFQLGDPPSTFTQWIGVAYVPAAVTCLGDANGDGTVDVNDISAVLFRLGLMPGDFGYEESADANGDGVIDVNDISYVLFRLGNACP